MAAIGGSNIVTNGLVLALDAGNTRSYPGSGTTWTDVSGSGNNGTLNNGPTFSSSDGGTIVLDGSNDYITASSIPSGTDNFTLSCWLYLNGNISGNFGPSIRGAAIFTGSAIGTMEFIVGTVDSNPGPPYSLGMGRYGGGTTGLCEALNINMPINRYHNIVLVRDGTASQRLFLNGELLNTGTVSNSFSAGTLHVGASPNGGTYSAYMNGRLSNILRYNRAITDAEVAQNYNALRGRFGL